MKKYLILLAALLTISFSVNAATSASGVIISGTTFGTSNAFQFTNTSDASENITKLVWDLSPINGFFDSISGGTFGQNGSGLVLSGSSDSVGHTFPTNVSLDGTSLLTIDFTDFNAGKTFQFGVDTDLFSAIDANGINGLGFIGALVTAYFSDNTVTHGFYTATLQSGFGSEVNITTPGVNAVPVPAALFMFAPALLGFFGLRRKVNG
ncbi:MAG: hypothetical protein COA95_03450 [Methylophaga sp.]|nr:MAG: hypothetical protein COA95_03450 [Methylophaga sp.]